MNRVWENGQNKTHSSSTMIERPHIPQIMFNKMHVYLSLYVYLQASVYRLKTLLYIYNMSVAIPLLPVKDNRLQGKTVSLMGHQRAEANHS